jgi:hypothetical protein
MCSIFLFMAAILQRRLMVVSDLHKSSTSMLFSSYSSSLVPIKAHTLLSLIGISIQFPLL